MLYYLSLSLSLYLSVCVCAVTMRDAVKQPQPARWNRIMHLIMYGVTLTVPNMLMILMTNVCINNPSKPKPFFFLYFILLDRTHTRPDSPVTSNPSGVSELASLS